MLSYRKRTENMLNLLKKYEEEYAADTYRGEKDGALYRHDDRKSRLILTAPHAVRIFRNGKDKAPDLYTGAITRLTGEQSGLSVIIRRRYTPAADSITTFITDGRLENRAFLDIHGMSINRGFELAVGTGILPAQKYENELALIDALATKYRIRWKLNHPDYTGCRGLTGDLQRLSPIPRILQLEWRLDLRDFHHYPENVLNRTLPFLSELAQNQNRLFPESGKA